MKAFSVSVLYLAVFAALVLVLSLLPWWDKVDVSRYTAAQEEALGDYLRRSLVESGTAVSNDTLDAAIQAVLDRLTVGLEHDESYDVYVLRDSTVNAFALPGRTLVFHTGLVEFAETPEEFAAVMAHEIAHSEKGHIMNKLMKEVGLELLFSSVAGGNGAVIREAGKALLSTGYDRTLETEADAYGQQLLERAGIDPSAMARFFERMKEAEGSGLGALEFLSTHPNHERRLEAAKAYATRPSFLPRPLEMPEWSAVRESLSE